MKTIDDGILILNKPQNWTSHDCVAVCRRVLRLKGIKKIGHGGTLDPMASGLLPIFIGQATRIMEYMDLDNKTYLCRARLGVRTNTQDIWGDVIEEKPFAGISEEEIRNALASFAGMIEQTPPAHSAVRIDGKHLYEYAHSGKNIEKEIPSRKVYIKRLSIRSIDLRAGTVEFELVCSKGTYVRTICQDLGDMLGCGATMEFLERTAVGDLDLTDSISPEDVKAMDDEEIIDKLDKILLPADATLKKFGVAFLQKDRADYFSHGGETRLGRVRIERRPRIEVDPITERIPENARGRAYDRIFCVYEEESGIFLGTGYEDIEKNCLKADKVFVPKR